MKKIIWLFILFCCFSGFYPLSKASGVDYSKQFALIQKMPNPPQLYGNEKFINKSKLVDKDKKVVFHPWDGYLEPDTVTITINGKSRTLTLPHSKNNITCIHSAIKKNSKVTKNNIINYCFLDEFTSFRGFSPSGYYLTYSTSGYESMNDILMDTRTGEVVLIMGFNSFMWWTKDRKSFIYGWSEGMSSEKWLYVTLPWEFPRTKEILEDNIWGGYIDNENIYVKTAIYSNSVSWEYGYGWYKLYHKVINIKTLKVIYSKEIKNP